MTIEMEVYKCNLCGNIVSVNHSGTGSLYCCGKKMTIQQQNINQDNIELRDKHLPIVEQISNIYYIIKIGVDSSHPMTKDHYIEWLEIELIDGTRIVKKLLLKEKPEIIFETKIPIKKIQLYCNLHGLWELNCKNDI